MALQLLTLRPPPNVDFISGYPGLAPGPPDRPHASVKGTLEIRSQQPLKVKWVHIELKKIESVPGSPPFVDIVGSKPTVLWEPQNAEFGILQSENIQFDIRIPESIPPTVVLDNGRSGIKYELLATLCAKGKKGLLRKESSPLSTASCEVVILKHELHSTWPVYAQPEVRETRKDGLTLVVSRKRTCLGSGGDSIAMQATLHAEIPVSVRQFELAVVQKINYPNTGTNQAGRRGNQQGPPPARSAVISEQKRPVGAFIQSGMHQTCELLCMLPPNYNAMTVATARLIENTYEVHVSAILEGNNTPITVGMPIIISPFPFNYSMDLMQRMGMPPMALDHPSRAHLHQQLANNSRPPSTSPSMQGHSQQQDPRMSQIGGHPAPRQQRPYHIAERIGGQAARDNSLLGGPPSPELENNYNAQTLPNQQGFPNGRIEPNGMNTYPNNMPAGSFNEMGQRIDTAPPNNAPYNATQPPTLSHANQTIQNTVNKFAVVNGSTRDDLDSPRSSRAHEPYLTAADEKRALAQKMTDPDAYASIPPPGAPPPTKAVAPAGGSPTSSTNMQAATSSKPQEKKWMSAEEEKKKLYEGAKAAAELTQRRAVNSSQNVNTAAAVKSPSPQSKQFTESQITPPAPITSPTPSTIAASPAPVKSSSSSSNNSKWLPAEEEKRLLYEKAQAKALRTQQRAANAASAAGSNVARSNSTLSTTGSINGNIINPYTYSGSSSTLKGADLYKAAMTNVKNTAPVSTPSVSETHVPVNVPVTPPPPTITPPAVSTPSSGQWMTAEDEKARLRYLEAKRAVDRHTAFQDEQFASSSSGGDYGGANYGSTSSYFPGNQSSSQSYASPPVTGTSASDYAPSSVPPRTDALSPGAYSSSHPGQSSISMATTPTPPPPSDLPAFEPSLGYTHATDLPEKEKMRLAYEARDTSVSSQAPPDYAAPPPGPYPGESLQFGSQNAGAAPPQPLTAVEEKARLRAQYASEETSASQSAGASSSAYNPPPPSFEPALSADGTRALTIAEEKARLQALQAAEKPVSATPPLPPPRIKSPPLSGPPSAVSEVNRGPPLSYTPSISTSVTSDDYLQRDPSIAQGKQRAITPSAETMPAASGMIPPPLAPRPPKEYIQQTKEQDARVRRMTQEAMNINFSIPDGGSSRDSVPWQRSGSPQTEFNGNFSLGLRPFSPIDLSIDTTPSFGQSSYAAQPGGTARTSYYH